MVDACAAVARDRLDGFRPEVFLLLGSGLSDAVSDLPRDAEVSYADLPGFAVPGVAGHPGKLVAGRWGGVDVLAGLGRLHRYEGHPWTPVLLPLVLAERLGARTVVLTNSSGAVNPSIPPGRLVVVADHLNFLGAPPTVGDDAGFGRRRSSTDVYSQRLGRLLHEAAGVAGVPLAEGVYAAMPGPNYETPAEVRMLRTLGADLVGMSTAGEALAAGLLGMECCAVSCAANWAAGVKDTAPISHHEVQAAGAAAAEPMRCLLAAFLGLASSLRALNPKTPKESLDSSR
ncbi:MAG: purine-nucleoside phosphorylase [Planctomycetia bacterium]